MGIPTNSGDGIAALNAGVPAPSAWTHRSLNAFAICLVVLCAGCDAPSVRAREAGPLGDCLRPVCIADQAEANARFASNGQLQVVSENLARAGRFAGARAAADRIDRSRPRGAFEGTSAQQAIIISEFAAASWAKPTRIASYSDLASLARQSANSPDETDADNYWLAAEEISTLTPWTEVPPDISELFHRKIIRRAPNATLSDLLYQRWPRLIAGEPVRRQGWHWDDLANLLLDIGDSAGAQKVVARLEQTGAYDSQNNNWAPSFVAKFAIRQGDYQRALKAANNAFSASGRIILQLEIARALVRSGQRQRAIAVYRSAAPESVKNYDQPFPLNGYLAVIDGLIDAGDKQDAQQALTKMINFARRPSLFPASNLALTANASNDVGDRGFALQLLHSAVTRTPDPRKIMAYGVTLGPITGSTLNLDDSIREQIAIEFYRAGEVSNFEKEVEVLSSYYRDRIWIDLYHEARRRNEPRPSANEMLAHLQPSAWAGFENDEAVDKLSSSEPGAARDITIHRRRGTNDAATIRRDRSADDRTHRIRRRLSGDRRASSTMCCL